MASVLAKTLKQENADFLAKLMPKMKAIADDTYKRVSNVPFLEWGRVYDRGSMSSGFFSSTDPLALTHKVDLTAAVSDALRELIGEANVELFFDDAKRLLSGCFETLFHKSGFTFAVYADKRPDDMKKDDDADASDKAVVLRVALSTA